MIKATVIVTLKEEVSDTHGQGIHNSLHLSGFSQVEKVKCGRLFTLSLNETDRRVAYMNVRYMCEQLLTNSLIEDYEIRIDSK
jgi:phosphoribosylformylglycinamidine synthase PurS subunit